MAFNFATTESAKSTGFIKPGRYRFKVKEIKLAKAKNSTTEFLTFTFENSDGQTLNENFMLTEKALGRLQYLHEAWAGKKLSKNFATTKEVAEFFTKVFVNPKAGSKVFQVGGKISTDGNVYAELPYADFILSDDTELGEFEEGSKEYKDSVKKAAASKNESTGKKGGVLNDDDDDDSSDSKAASSDDDDEPW